MVRRSLDRRLERRGGDAWMAAGGPPAWSGDAGQEGRHVHPDAGAHRGGHGQASQVLALHRAGLGPIDGVEEGGEVIGQLIRTEARPAEGDLDDAALVDLELDPPTLDLVDGSLEIEGDGPRLG